MDSKIFRAQNLEKLEGMIDDFLKSGEAKSIVSCAFAQYDGDPTVILIYNRK